MLNKEWHTLLEARGGEAPTSPQPRLTWAAASAQSRRARWRVWLGGWVLSCLAALAAPGVVAAQSTAPGLDDLVFDGAEVGGERGTASLGVSPPAGWRLKGPGRVTVIESPVGRQFVLLGGQLATWWGDGTIRALIDEGELSDEARSASTRAYHVGPIHVGFAHVVAPQWLFELRLGLGVMVFEDDRLLRLDFPEEGDVHVGLTLSAEVLGRYVSDLGLTGALGVQLARQRLPDAWSTSMNLSPRLGYLAWGARRRSFVLYEVGAQVPMINGFIPDNPQAGREAPIESTWAAATLSVTWGF